jgi:hypothetical protein
VIGIHGQGDTVGAVRSESGGGQEEIKTGFNAAIPINTFVGLLSQVEMQLSQLTVDKSAPDNVDAEEVKQGDVDRWFKAFAFNVGIRIIDRIPRPRLPF